MLFLFYNHLTLQSNIMKRLLFALACFLATTGAKAALFINNNTTCSADLMLRAHDVNNPGSCAYYSLFTLAAGTSAAYNNVTAVNAPTGPGWTLVGTTGFTNMVQTGSGWDGCYVTLPGFTAGVGAPGACTQASSVTGFSATCGTITCTWTIIGSNVFLDIM